VFRNYTIGVDLSNDATLRFLRQAGYVRPNVNVIWANYWTSSISISRNLPLQSASLTRGGPLMARPAGLNTSINFGNRVTSPTRWYGSRYVFAYIDRSTVSTEFRLSYTLKPDMNLDVYAEPFAASGRYYDYGELLAPREAQRLLYGASGTTMEVRPDGTRIVRIGALSYTLRNRDFNTLSFRSNVVLRWEWRPGSTLYLVWQQDRASTERIGSFVTPADMFRSVTAPGNNVFVIKTSFWMPIG
jgi:hypothetical protein